jgi:hypothetical protein
MCFSVDKYFNWVESQATEQQTLRVERRVGLAPKLAWKM